MHQHARTHLLTCSLALTRSLTHPLTHSHVLTHSLTLTYSPTHSLSHSLNLLTHCMSTGRDETGLNIGHLLKAEKLPPVHKHVRRCTKHKYRYYMNEVTSTPAPIFARVVVCGGVCVCVVCVLCVLCGVYVCCVVCVSLSPVFCGLRCIPVSVRWSAIQPFSALKCSERVRLSTHVPRVSGGQQSNLFLLEVQRACAVVNACSSCATVCYAVACARVSFAVM